MSQSVRSISWPEEYEVEGLRVFRELGKNHPNNTAESASRFPHFSPKEVAAKIEEMYPEEKGIDPLHMLGILGELQRKGYLEQIWIVGKRTYWDIARDIPGSTEVARYSLTDLGNSLAEAIEQVQALQVPN